MQNHFPSILVALGMLAAGCTTNNHRPVVETLAAAPTRVAPGGRSTVTAEVSDEDGDSLTRLWQPSGGSVVELGPDSVMWVAPQDTNTYQVTLVVADPGGAADTASVSIGVGPNLLPTIDSMSARPDPVRSLEACTLTVFARDPEGLPLSFRWRAPVGIFLDSTAATVCWRAPLSTRSHQISVTARDSAGGTETDSLLVQVTADTSVLVDSTFAVYPGGHRYARLGLGQVPYAVEGQFTAQGGPINLLVLDEANYRDWADGLGYAAICEVLDVDAGSFSFGDSLPGVRYIVLDNTGDRVAGRTVVLRAVLALP